MNILTKAIALTTLATIATIIAISSGIAGPDAPGSLDPPPTQIIIEFDELCTGWPVRLFGADMCMEADTPEPERDRDHPPVAPVLGCQHHD